MANKLGVVAAVLGFLYILYQRVMSFYFNHTVKSEESGLVKATTSINKEQGKLDKDRSTYETDLKSFDPKSK
jgi:hypothetical protein